MKPKLEKARVVYDPRNKDAIYSIKLFYNGQEYIITAAVGQKGMSFSLHDKKGDLLELIRHDGEKNALELYKKD